MRPRAYCDFAGALVGHDTFALYPAFLEDLAAQGVEVGRGLEVTFWDGDADAEGNEDNVLVDGVVDQLEPWGWVARVDPATWRHESEDRGRMPSS